MSEEEDEEENDTLFEEYVEGKDGVCGNCFRRTHEVEEKWYPERLPAQVEDILQDPKYFPNKDQVIKVYPKSKTAAYPSSRNICKCGVFDPYQKIRPLTKHQLLVYTRHAAERLEESGIDFNKEVLFTYVKETKSDPDEQFQDDQILEDAIEAAHKEAVNDRSD